MFLLLHTNVVFEILCSEFLVFNCVFTLLVLDFSLLVLSFKMGVVTLSTLFCLTLPYVPRYRGVDSMAPESWNGQETEVGQDQAGCLELWGHIEVSTVHCAGIVYRSCCT